MFNIFIKKRLNKDNIYIECLFTIRVKILTYLITVKKGFL